MLAKISEVSAEAEGVHYDHGESAFVVEQG
jgi:hypothetical protein